MGVVDNRFLESKDVIDIVVPVGVSYIQFADTPLPGDELISFEDAVMEFTDEELAACLYPGTKWRMAVRAGDFLRQEGTRVIDEENNISIGSENIGDTQEDSFQGHGHQTYYESGYTSSNGALYSCESTQAAQSNYSYPQTPISDGSNGDPRTGSETRPVNTAVRYWVRLA